MSLSYEKKEKNPISEVDDWKIRWEDEVSNNWFKNRHSADRVDACNKAQMWRSSSRKIIILFILLYHFESSFCFTVFLPAVKYAISLLEFNLSFRAICNFYWTVFGNHHKCFIWILPPKIIVFFRNYVSVSSCCKKGQKRFFGNLSGKKRGYLLRFHLNLQ